MALDTLRKVSGNKNLQQNQLVPVGPWDGQWEWSLGRKIRSRWHVSFLHPDALEFAKERGNTFTSKLI